MPKLWFAFGASKRFHKKVANDRGGFYEQTVLDQKNFLCFRLKFFVSSTMNTSALRTQGDGTESPDVAETAAAKIHRKPSADDSKIEKLGKEYLAKQQTTSTTILFDPHQTDSGKYNFPPPVEPKGKRFYFIPKLAKQSEVNRGLKKRQLNLVLIEPYKVSSLDAIIDSRC